MNLYKKNPEIEGSFFLNGKEVDDETVLAGDKWELFANPATFPGLPPKLVKVEFGDLSKKQQAVVAAMTPADTEIPPKHLGVIKSSSFNVESSGDLSISSHPDVKKQKQEARAREVAERANPAKAIPKKTEIVILDEYDEEGFIEDFPGVTPKNVKRVLKKYRTLEELKEARNTDLARLGVRSNFYGRVRETAEDIIKALNDKNLSQ